MLQRSKVPASRRCAVFGSLVVATTALAATALVAPAAAAAPGWSRTPGSGLGGGTVSVASSSTTPCRWTQPAAGATTTDPTTTDPPPPNPAGQGGAATPAVTPAADPVTLDGTEVQVRMSRGGVDTQIGRLPVTSGGAWSGTVTVPDREIVAPGDYQMIVRCVVDRPGLDGVQTFDFEPLPFTVIEGPPPTTVEIPTELVPPLVVTNPVQVEGEQITRPAVTPTPASASAATPASTLPNTGDGTLGVALAGLGALLVGGGALWFGARHARRHPAADLLD